MKAGGAYMKNKEFYLDCDGIALHAKMDFPEVEKPVYPMVIVIHGLTGHMEERHIKGLAAACNQAGYATLRVELYGHGKSGGDFKNHTIAHWVLEIMRVIDYAKSLDFVPICTYRPFPGRCFCGAGSCVKRGLLKGADSSGTGHDDQRICPSRRISWFRAQFGKSRRRISPLWGTAPFQQLRQSGKIPSPLRKP